MKLKLFIFSLLFSVHYLFSQTSLKAINLDYGDYTVGFRHYTKSDHSRTYTRLQDWTNRSISRPIPISIWYPSIKSDKSPLSILNYMEIVKEEEEWEYLPNEQILNWFEFPNTPKNQEHLKESAIAILNSQALKGKFPVILYSASLRASSVENFGICEYLASHGYIVIASSARGTEHRFQEGGTLKDVETQARDLEFLIKEIKTFPSANIEKIATLDYSLGGLAAVLTQMRNDNIKAMVSLDGKSRYDYNTLMKSPYAKIENVDVPYLHMAQKIIPEQVLKEDHIDPELNTKFQFYDSLTNSKAYRLRFHNLSHSQFGTLGLLLKSKDKRQDKSDLEIMESYKLLSKYTLNFLNAYLKNDVKALQFIENTPQQNSIKERLISKQFKKPNLKSFSFQDFNDLAAKQGYKNLKKIYDSLSLKYPNLQLPEGRLNNLGLQLIFNPKTSSSGISIFTLATQIYPNSSNLFDSLAEGHLHLGDTKNAIINFEKSLKLNSENQNAINRLLELKK
ncbi:alpha/beta hydrolase [Flavobacteriaceae bacterium AU392]|nr:alpha/beta hydrolase [Flavobacteriaceae bacterium]RKM81122.1 alpha/beta hydrolase [Flavobacteriaceae bacterium AU392]